MWKVFKTPLILLGVALIAGIGLYISHLYEKRSSLEKEKRGKLFLFDSLNVVEVIIKRNERNDEVHFKKLGEDNWIITSPIEVEADPYIPKGIARKLEGEEIKRTLKKSEVENLSEFGLDKPKFEIKIKTNDGKEFRLFVGNKAPIGYSAYATKEEDENIYLITAGILNDLDKEMVDYRNRKIMDFSTTDLTQLKIKRAKEEILFEKETEEKWRLMPMNVKASKDEVLNFISTIRELKVKDFIDDNPKDLSQYGLSAPPVIIEVIRKEKEPLILKLGKRFKKEKEELVYAMKEGGKSVYSVPSKIYDQAIKRAVDFREKKPIVFYTWKTTHLNISTPDGSFIFEKDSEGNWWLIIGSEKIKAKETLVDDLLRAIRNIEVLEFVDEPSDLKRLGLENPPYIIKIHAEGESPIEVLISSPFPKGVYFKIADEKHVYLTKKEVIEKFKIDKEVYKEEEKKEGEKVEAK